MNSQFRKGDAARRRQKPSAVPDALVTGRMLSQMIRPSGRAYTIATPSLDENDVVIHGNLNNYNCHSGLRVHATDTLEAHDLNTETLINPELTVAVFLEGVVEMELDGERIRLGDPSEPIGHAWTVTRRVPSRRMSRKGTRIRKVLVSAPHTWINAYIDDLPGDGAVIAAFMNTHRNNARWTPSKRTLALCEQILNPSPAPHVIQRMNIESKAIEIFSDALSVLAGLSESNVSDGPSVRAINRAQEIRAYVLDHIDDNLSLTMIARELGCSVESMQRAFKTAYGATIVDFIREYRLHQARHALVSEGISISEAAYRAGYSNPANFSTAFKKLFGLTPSDAKS
ncbi:MAG: helix-turn-helix transcriptional regulator [Rhodospirillales bacterium]|nr:helix-turn-helix transcriptional regulator [Rhodospirillales bacterium]MBO6785722.1 helix-turn-helix transcriptional regulator [Rhodospirillales bacterium]